MSRNGVIGIVIALIVIAIAAWYLSTTNFGASSMATSTAATSTATTTAASGGSSATGTSAASGTVKFKSIFSQSGNYECDFSQVNSSAQGRNVIYIADGKMRGEFRTSSGDITTATLMIYSGGYLYSWQEGANTGTKTKINSLADLPTAVPQNLRSGAVIGSNDSSVGWNCHDWNKDSSVFTIPTYVTFKSA